MEKSLKMKAYSYIKDKIIKCEFEPGTYIDEKTIVNDFGTSRTPVKEALQKIEEEGYIKIVPKKGIYITKVTMTIIQDVFQVREIIEPIAVSKYGQNLSIQKINDFKTLYSTRGFTEELANEYDDSFHKFLVSGYNNQYMTNLYDDITEQNQRIRQMAGKLGNTLDVTYSEHIYILNLLENIQLEKASIALLDHLHASKRRIIERF